MKRKEEERPRVERELSDAYIESISRTPRYGLGRHNTYDDMLTSINPEDPFKGDYQPSGKTPREKSKIPKPSKKRDQSGERRENFFDEERTEKHYKKKSRKHKKKKTEEIQKSAGESIAHTNDAYLRTPTKLRPNESDKESVKSNGTYTLGNEKTKDIQSSIANMAAPVLKKSPHKVKSVTCSAKDNCRDSELDSVSGF